MLSKDEFVLNYIGDRTEAAMAKGLLPAGEKPLEEWQKLWKQILNSPAQ